MKPPRYYDSLFEHIDAESLSLLKSLRLKLAKKFKDNCTPERLKVREYITQLRLNRLLRNHDVD